MPSDVYAFGNFMQIVIVSTVCLVATALGARILWRLGSRIKPSSSPSASREHDDRLHHLETAVDTIAIEVERISEAQRFVVGLLAESNQLKRGEQSNRPDPVDLSLTNRSTGRTNTPH